MEQINVKRFQILFLGGVRLPQHCIFVGSESRNAGLGLLHFILICFFFFVFFFGGQLYEG